MSDIAVAVDTRFMDAESDPLANRYLFAYTITITNHGSTSSQLLNRYWLITNGDGKKEEVHGPGVVGEQPRLNPGEAFRYTSGAVLETAVGTMEGHFEFQRDDGDLFKVAIPPFSLAVPYAVH
ncbi:MAG: Co2+/Mg2+ efflux protein ApaG [Pseudomonadales bacterium]